MSKELIINALLAGLWAGLAAFAAAEDLSKVGLFAAVAIAARATIGYLAARSGKTIVVDE
jgi:hypothetical protein